MPRYLVARHGTRIPAPGGKRIEELLGRATTGTDGLSLAHMVAPPGWGEPAQQPEFGELTVMVRGRMRIEVDGEMLDLAAGQAIWVEAEARVRYSNPFAEENEYFAICLPAFTLERARREPE